MIKKYCLVTISIATFNLFHNQEIFKSSFYSISIKKSQLLIVTNLRATDYHLPYGITHCHLPPDTSKRAPPYISARQACI